MPSSSHSVITPILTEIMRARPTSVLDVGSGFGKWGHLIREYTDVWAGRFDPKDWQVRIDGIEIFEPYVIPAVRGFYDEMIYGDLRDVITDLARYEVILAVDVIEHLPKVDAIGAIMMLSALASKVAIFSIPLGDRWLGANQSAAEVNPAERHLSSWTEEEVQALPHFSRSLQVPGVRGPIGLFAFESK